jgi:two-component system sensor histidine kinase/response regulator
MKILIVDDEDPIREVLIDILADANYEAIGVRNGREAVECLRTHPGRFQLVLLDVMMPALDGWGVLEAMRGDPSLAVVPVVIMTAAENVHQKALKRGAVGYLPKPIDLNELLETVEFYSRDQQVA